MTQLIGFDGWTVRADTGELTRGGESVRLQEQPLRILVELLSKPGELVTREQLAARLWPRGIVDFDAGLNSCVRKLRIALHDEAESPRYIETVPRKGYRFIGTLDAALPQDGGPDVPALAPTPSRRWPHIYAYISAGLAILAIGSLAYVKQSERVVEPARLSAPTMTRNKAIAVLPFSVANNDAQVTQVADGLVAMLRARLEGIGGLRVIPGTSSEAALRLAGNPVGAGEKLKATHLLAGKVVQAGNRIRVEIALLDAGTGSELWTQQFEQSPAALAALRESVAQSVAETMQVAFKPDATDASIDLDAYAIYASAQRLMATLRADDVAEATQLFSRVTELDPQFAPAYAEVALSLIVGADAIGTSVSRDGAMRAERMATRALELNPALGEPWLVRARLAEDPSEAEKFYRRALELAPDRDYAYAFFAKFLSDRQRRAEAIELIERGSEADPLSVLIHQSQAVMLIFGRSDLAASQAVLREALAISPDNPATLAQLATSEYHWSGETAEGIRLAERLISVQPLQERARSWLTAMYLDVADAGAAGSLLRDFPSPAGLLEVAQFRGDVLQAGALAATLPIGPRDVTSPVAEAVRDAAMLTGDYGPAITRLEDARVNWKGAPISNRATSLVYAHALILSGNERSGRQVATDVLELIEAEGSGRPREWFARERAAALAMLGEDQRALDELELSVRHHRLVRWWYLAERDPLYESIRRDPRFRAIDEQAVAHRTKQRSLLDEMRRKGEVPRRK